MSDGTREPDRLVLENEALRRQVAALAADAERCKTTLQSIGDAVISVDTGGNILRMNPVAQTLTGWGEPEALGQPLARVFRIVNEETRAEVESPVERLLREGVVVGLANHTLLIAKDGKEHPIADSGEPIRDEKGETTGAVLVFHDQTTERAIQKALREGETCFRDAFERATVGKSMTGPNGRLLKVNQALADMLGYSIEELQRVTAAQITHPDDIAETQECIRCLFAGERTSYRMEKRYRHRDGHFVFADVGTALLRDAKGAPLCLITSIVDITERKQTEEGLRIQAERLRSLHLIDQAILMAVESPEAIAQMALPLLRRLLHCQRASVGVFDLEKKEVRVFAADVSGETIVQRGQVLEEEAFGDLEILRQGGMQIAEDMSRVTSPPAIGRALQMEGVKSFINVPIVSAHGLCGALNIGWDAPRIITPEEVEIAGEMAGQIAIAMEQGRLLQETKCHAVELEERVRAHTAQLEESNKELEAFSYSVSHDLRAPLRAIDGFTRILADDYAPHLDTEGKRLCSVIHENTGKMGRLIDDLLAFSRLGRAEMSLSWVDMGTMANSVFHELTTPESRARIDFQVGTVPPAVADPALMRQVWMNLLSNAIKFSSRRERAVIEVSAQQDEGETIYAVRDNGAGFDMQYAGKLFAVFQRLHSTREFEGTGVGLALVQRVVRRHGGRVWAQGEPDKGAIFYFALQ